MTADYLMGLLLGHMAGDYLLQNQWMALNKSRAASWLPGFVHACIYTAAVLLLTWDFRWTWALVIFASHWPVDRWSLGEKWLDFIGGRTMTEFLNEGHRDIWRWKCGKDVVSLSTSGEKAGLDYLENYRILRGSFTALVYAAADNTIHLLLMWGGWHLLRAL